jgi:hypothetical protein
MHPDELPEYINIPGPVRTMIGQHLPRDIVVRGGWEKSCKDKALSLFHSHCPQTPPGLGTKVALGTVLLAAQAFPSIRYNHPFAMAGGYGLIDTVATQIHDRVDLDYPLPIIPPGGIENRFQRVQRLENKAGHQRANLKFGGLLAAGLAITYASMAVPEVQTTFLENQTTILENQMAVPDFPSNGQINSVNEFTVTL